MWEVSRGLTLPEGALPSRDARLRALAAQCKSGPAVLVAQQDLEQARGGFFGRGSGGFFNHSPTWRSKFILVGSRLRNHKGFTILQG